MKNFVEIDALILRNRLEFTADILFKESQVESSLASVVVKLEEY